MGIRTSTCSEAQLLDTYVNSSYDVIKQAVDNLNTITLLANLSENSEAVDFLQTLITNIDDITSVVNSTTLLQTVADDIAKGSYFGSRKLDIDLSLNKIGIDPTTTASDALAIWQNTATTVYYYSAKAYFSDNTIITVPFVTEGGDPTLESTHGGIVNQLNNSTTFTNKLDYTSITVDIGGKIGSIIRITDTVGSISNLERLELLVSTGEAIDSSPDYWWVETTSSMQVLADRVSDVIALGNNITDLILLGDNIDLINTINNNLAELLVIETNLAGILDALNQANAAAASATAAATSATNAATFASSSEGFAVVAQNYANAADVAKIEWQGAWDSGTTYNLNDAVTHSDASYICIQQSLNNAPAPGGTAYWDVLARAGLDGAGSGDLISTNNLNDVSNASLALSNLGGQPLATVLTNISSTGTNSADGEFLVGTGAGTFAWESGAVVRTSLGLGNSALLDTGVTAGTVAVGNHTHAGLYEPADSTILKESELAGTGVATTPARSDHNHDTTYEPIGQATALAIALG